MHAICTLCFLVFFNLEIQPFHSKHGAQPTFPTLLLRFSFASDLLLFSSDLLRSWLCVKVVLRLHRCTPVACFFSNCFFLLTCLFSDIIYGSELTIARISNRVYNAKLAVTLRILHVCILDSAVPAFVRTIDPKWSHNSGYPGGGNI